MLTRRSTKLTHAGALAALAACVARAEAMGVPQCIAVVDASGVLLAFVRMDGARFLSNESAIAKATSAASTRMPTSRLPVDMEVKLALATGGRLTNLKGGVPIIVEGECIGGIGVGSGTGSQDLEVARAGLAAIGAEDQTA
ncbi:uncharacterized protein GlcG (DUF336 family) [Tepidamorphus gemmatus]|jgi:glc operon protein GlcG|uniref:Uncharacterized protein GlcG (DUF336 family) n=1 Tax=Tepidamorphus gemmatus TaxID=747076 RepID=A0A4R3MFJ5_9HYPH|nr:heme-binding protein [Tepidamorphus gemmatus]TCT11932.1 uncharacterized protein GlcG (DUF336 family) [Tepidamorphus gemmatus]